MRKIRESCKSAYLCPEYFELDPSLHIAPELQD